MSMSAERIEQAASQLVDLLVTDISISPKNLTPLQVPQRSDSTVETLFIYCVIYDPSYHSATNIPHPHPHPLLRSIEIAH